MKLYYHENKVLESGCRYELADVLSMELSTDDLFWEILQRLSDVEAIDLFKSICKSKEIELVPFSEIDDED